MPYIESDIAKVVVYYRQNGKILLRRVWTSEKGDTEPITVNDKAIVVKISARESRRFMETSTVKVRIQVMGANGDVVKSNTMTAVTDN
jgi:hypothetical protein